MRIDSRGGVGIGATILVGYSLKVSKGITNNITSYGIVSDGQIQSDVTSRVEYYRSEASTAEAAFNLQAIIHYRSQQTTFGAGSSVTNQYGFFADTSIVGATNNYGFWGAIPSGTNRWNLYMVGTAANYMAGDLGIGATSPTAMSSNTKTLEIKGQVSSKAGGIRLTSSDNSISAYLYPDSTSGFSIGTISNLFIRFVTNNTERVRVKSTGQMQFVPLDSDQSGAEAVDIYYNSTISALKLYDGTVWRTITVI
jgi:hypothetical protein